MPNCAVISTLENNVTRHCFSGDFIHHFYHSDSQRKHKSIESTKKYDKPCDVFVYLVLFLALVSCLSLYF